MPIRLHDLKEACAKAKEQGISLRHRFVLYLMALLCAFAALILILLTVFGVLNPVDSELERVFARQLEASGNAIERDSDALAAYAISFSRQLTAGLERTLVAEGLRFEDLRDNAEALKAVQGEVYGTVYAHLQLAPCSGAFFFLRTTVNDALPEASYSGLYLKYSVKRNNGSMRKTIFL